MSLTDCRHTPLTPILTCSSIVNVNLNFRSDLELNEAHTRQSDKKDPSNTSTA